MAPNSSSEVSPTKVAYPPMELQILMVSIQAIQAVKRDVLTLRKDDFTDPLADPSTCNRDIPYLQQLDTNVIRTYALDPTLDHSGCMAALDAAGIYVISDLSEPALSINRADPAWDTQLYARYTAVIDSMANYTNVIGFFAGNEVTNNVSYTPASAFVKAAVRDMKSYITQKNYRPMGIGYAADDDATVRLNVANYFNCGDPADGIDFWGYNIYSWCGDSSYVQSGYIDRVAEFANYSVPVFFAEYGCNTQGGGAAGRMFTEVGTLYGSDMDVVFSGGIVYEYFEDTNDYGLVSVDGNTVSTLADFNAFSTQIHAVTPTGTNSASYTPTNTIGQACPTVDVDWQVNSTTLPPTPNEALCSCMVSSLTCTAKAGIADTEIGTLFSQVCGYNSGKPCLGILKNTTTGVYGAYSMCNSTEQLSYAFNAYYQEEGNAQACDFGGNAQTVKAAAASTCSSLIASATGASSPGSTTGTGSSSSSTTTKKSAAGAVTVGASLGIGTFCMVAYISALVLSGAGIFLL